MRSSVAILLYMATIRSHLLHAVLATQTRCSCSGIDGFVIVLRGLESLRYVALTSATHDKVMLDGFRLAHTHISSVWCIEYSSIAFWLDGVPLGLW